MNNNKLRAGFVFLALFLALFLAGALFVVANLSFGHWVETYIAMLVVVGVALVLGRASLKALTVKNMEQEWLYKGQLKIAKSVRGALSLDETASAILASLCDYVSCQLGALYLLYDGKGLVLAGEYAIDKKSRAKSSFKEKTSIAQEVLKHGEVKILNDIPEDYFKVSTGLGTSLPKQILIAPIMIEGEQLGVIELGSFDRFSNKKVVLIERTLEIIGLSMIAAKARENFDKNLLEINRQKEELLQSNESLERKTRELESSQDELQTQTKTLAAANQKTESQAAELESQNRLLQTQKDQILEQAEELAHRVVQVERANEYKSQFLANMSHELRTPLNSLLILAKSFQNNEDGNLTKEQMEEAAMIYNGGLELLNLINDVLDFSKIESGKLSILKDQMRISYLVDRLSSQFLVVAKEKNLKLDAKIDSDVPEFLYTDEQRLAQILRNLLSNAIKFTQHGEVLLHVFRHAEGVAFSVKDTGIGIEDSKREEIFEAFQQEDGSIERKYGGTGLGLAISKDLAALIDGHITLETQKSVGSTFTVILPISDEQSAGSGDASTDHQSALSSWVDTTPQKMSISETNAGDTKTQRFLIVEDNEPMAKSLEKLAKKQGYDAMVAKTAKDALVLSRLHNFVAVILDIQLPDMSGLKVLEQLKSDIKTRHIPVHVISAYAEAEGDSLKKGAIGYLTKPLDDKAINSMFAKLTNVSQKLLKHLLVVEDDLKTQKAIGKLLKSKNLEIEFCETGGDASKKIQSQDFDCVILDLQLPDTTGLEWLNEMTSDKKVSLPPVIIYTARHLTKEEAQALEEHAESIIVKGTHSPERLLDEVMLFLHSLKDDLSDEQQDAIENQIGKDSLLESRKVLLVDDDMRNVFAMSKMLKKHGLQVVIADNGQTALNALQKHNDVDVVVTDIMMPVMDGYQAIAKIRQLPKYSEVPIIALTARTMPEEREKCLSMGATDYLAKPVDIDVLLTLMRVLLSKQES